MGGALSSQNHDTFSAVQWHRVKRRLVVLSGGRTEITSFVLFECKLSLFPGLPECLSDEESPASAGGAGDKGSVPGWGRSPGGGNDGTPVFLPGKPHGQRSPADFSLWGHKESATTGAAQR